MAKYAFQKGEVKWENDAKVKLYADKYGNDSVFDEKNNPNPIINNYNLSDIGVYST